MNKDREKILAFARELWEKWEITKDQLEDTYYELFVSKTRQLANNIT
jgi:hypothetical protein